MTAYLKGAEPFEFTGSRASVLVLHGFTGTTQSMRYLGEELHRRFGFSVLGPCLPGHGTSPDEMEKTDYRDWVGAAEDALRDLASRGDPVFVTGLSMGGMLTLGLAAQFGDLLSGIAPINAIAGVNDGGLAEVVMTRNMPERVPGIGSDIKAAGVEELAYAEVPTACLRSVYLAQAAIGDILHKVVCPTLVIQSREDHVVHPDNAYRIMRKINAVDRRLLWLEESYHVATLDNDKAFIAQQIGAFVDGILARAE
ncbi:alpha/beta hydrolase [Sulfitobacter guttiformis]|uniref:Carboxylesterase n=1 Tax=Sulfitobacter guttiformis TaxID=74349 RepID=A0A420DUB0_9RHOB|nr:alpha/beta fold hydrolase [Sulfitobacter guttiformis]KIN71320.1 putative carboxylesterase [Sulfitobacter guttiformis KCTC 32187]RKE97773.1 carboxylesterase [Sulfitobacter guttiformis]